MCAAQAQSTNKTILGTEGELVSPGYPSPYPPDQHLTTTLVAPPNTRIVVTVHFLSLEDQDQCLYDYLVFQDLPSQEEHLDIGEDKSPKDESESGVRIDDFEEFPGSRDESDYFEYMPDDDLETSAESREEFLEEKVVSGDSGELKHLPNRATDSKSLQNKRNEKLVSVDGVDAYLIEDSAEIPYYYVDGGTETLPTIHSPVTRNLPREIIYSTSKSRESVHGNHPDFDDAELESSGEHEYSIKSTIFPNEKLYFSPDLQIAGRRKSQNLENEDTTVNSGIKSLKGRKINAKNDLLSDEISVDEEPFELSSNRNYEFSSTAHLSTDMEIIDNPTSPYSSPKLPSGSPTPPMSLSNIQRNSDLAIEVSQSRSFTSESGNSPSDLDEFHSSISGRQRVPGTLKNFNLGDVYFSGSRSGAENAKAADRNNTSVSLGEFYSSEAHSSGVSASARNQHNFHTSTTKSGEIGALETGTGALKLERDPGKAAVDTTIGSDVRGPQSAGDRHRTDYLRTPEAAALGARHIETEKLYFREKRNEPSTNPQQYKTISPKYDGVNFKQDVTSQATRGRRRLRQNVQEFPMELNSRERLCGNMDASDR